MVTESSNFSSVQSQVEVEGQPSRHVHLKGPDLLELSLLG